MKKYTHTLPYEHLQETETEPVDLEIDKVTANVLLSSNTSPYQKEQHR